MVAALLLVLALFLTARAWREGRRAEPSRVPKLLARLAIASVTATLLLPAAALSPRGLAIPLVLLVGIAALVTFDALVSLALWGKFRRITNAVRAPFAVVAIILILTRQSLSAIAFTGAIALLSYRWRDALRTVGLFRTFLGSVALIALFLAPIPGENSGIKAGWFGPLVTFVRITLGIARLYVLIGMFKTFAAFTRDPSLGIRTVTHRLALSHVLVLLVPLGITLALWVSTTYLGVNADRALAGRRLLERESTQLAMNLRAAAASGDAATRRLGSEQRRHWPGTRLWLDRGHGLERILGDSIAGESRLPGWFAGLDTLPDHGVIGLRGKRWIGAAIRPGSGTAGVMLIAPARDAFDSTLTPVLGARFSMREGVNDAVDLAPADSIALAAADTLTPLQRDVRALGSGSRAAASNRPSQSGPRLQFSGSRGSKGFSVSTATERDTNAAIAFSGMAIITGPEATRTRWRSSEFMLVARADLRTTLAGLYSNVRENPLQAVPITMLALLVLLLLPVAVTDFSMVRRMGGSIAQAIGALRDGAAALGRGQLEHRIEIRGDDDLWETARQFNRMAEGLERARSLEKERARLESEMELARRIQQRLLPAEPPAVPGLEIAGLSEPAREVGGDYYDHFDLGGGRVLLVIADVSGKGVPAALLMSGFRASLMSQDANGLGPDRLAERVNDFLHRSVETGKFVTAFLGFLDAASGRLVYANAGHKPPALLRADRRVEWLAAGGTVLGIMPSSRFESGEAVLEPGDLLALYTDGVTEGADASHELWGEERLVAALRRLSGRPCTEAAEALVREVRTFEGDTGPADDITVLLARRA